ncbi:MAG: hypothetical protein KBC26_02510 [Candidatus Pacebacteria bacterium]|nr:hypothetical protein [Candidatus Paceibacterota bacterium]
MKKIFVVALAMALVVIACAVAGASPPPHQAGIAVVAATADNWIGTSSSEPAGMTTRSVWSMEVTLAPIMTPSSSSSTTTTATVNHYTQDVGTTARAATNPTRDPEPEVVDLCRYAAVTTRYYLDDGTRATVVNHPLRS